MAEPPVAGDSGSRDEPPLSGGVFRRLSRWARRLGGSAVPVVEELYGPTHREAQVEIQRQHEAAEPVAPSPDPPDEPPADLTDETR